MGILFLALFDRRCSTHVSSVGEATARHIGHCPTTSKEVCLCGITGTPGLRVFLTLLRSSDLLRCAVLKLGRVRKENWSHTASPAPKVLLRHSLLQRLLSLTPPVLHPKHKGYMSEIDLSLDDQPPSTAAVRCREVMSGPIDE